MKKRSLPVYLKGFAMLLLLLPMLSYSQTEHKKSKEYSEDLSGVRPAYAVSDSIEMNKGKKSEIEGNTNEINSKIDSLTKKSNPIKHVQGYRVLVYSGKESAEVVKAKTKVYELFPDIDIYKAYKAPNQLVKVGDYMDRAEAYSVFKKLKVVFPNAVIIPDKINIKAK